MTPQKRTITARRRLMFAIEAYAYHMGLSRLRRTPLDASWILTVRRTLTAYTRAVRLEKR